MNKTELVTDDLTSVRINDRLAKIAAVFAGGRISIVYGAPPSTDGHGKIFLPSACRSVALGLYRTQSKARIDFERMTWAYVNHEMGHVDVEYKLRHARSRGHVARASEALYNLIPDNLKNLAVKPGGAIVLPSELVADANGANIRGHQFSEEYGADPETAGSQLFLLFNVAEDPRQETMVASRWRGAGEHMEYANEIARANLRKSSEQEKNKFKVFAIALMETIAGHDVSWAGATTALQTAAVIDIVKAYRAANWTDAQGCHDAINFALAVLGRMYENEPKPEPSEPEESKSDVDDAPKPENKGPDDDEEPEGKDGSNAEDEEEGEREEAQDSSGDEPGADQTPDQGDDSPTPENEDEGGKTANDHAELRVGSIVRPSGKGIRFRVTEINDDGSIEAEPITDDEVREVFKLAKEKAAKDAN